jgi:hypothetical protein
MVHSLLLSHHQWSCDGLQGASENVVENMQDILKMIENRPLMRAAFKQTQILLGMHALENVPYWMSKIIGTVCSS